MLIRILERTALAAALCWTLAAPAAAGARQAATPPADKSAQEPKDASANKPKKAKSDKPKKAKKEKKPKKAKPDVAAPDEPIDGQAGDTGGKGARVSWKQHPSFRVGSWFRVDYQMKFQEDGRASYEGARQLDPWEMHRNRIGISGYVTKGMEYEVEYELTEKELTENDVLEGVTPVSYWKDVNVNIAYINNAQVQIGKFKIPFGLDQLTGVTHNDFVYRSLGGNYLAPARDIGVMVHGRFFKRGLNYWVGGFKHDGDNARSKKIQGGDETFAGRVTGTPFRAAGAALGALELGTAFTTTSLSDDSFRPNGLRGRTLITQETFYDPVYVRGHRKRWEADADWAAGPVGARAEYTIVLDDRLGQGLLDDDLVDARARSWYVSGSWLLTGEEKQRPVKPANDFLQGGVGAVEVVARYERLWFDSVGGGEPYRSSRAESILPAGDRVFTIGANWTLNRFIKLQVNGIREQTHGVREHSDETNRNPVQNGTAFWSRVFRLQLVL